MCIFEAALLAVGASYIYQKFCCLFGCAHGQPLPDWVGLSVSPLVLFVLIGSIQSLHGAIEGEIRFLDDELRVESVAAIYVRRYRSKPAFSASWEHLQVRARPYRGNRSKDDRMECELLDRLTGRTRHLLLSSDRYERLDNALREEGVLISEW